MNDISQPNAELPLSAEASTLGWPPGQIPHYVDFAGQTFGFVGSDKDAEGDVLAFNYLSSTGRKLVVFND